MASSGLIKKQSFSKSLTSPAWGLPPQMVSDAEKETTEWQKACMDYFDYQSSAHQVDKAEDLKKCRIVSGEFDIKDYKYVTDPLTIMNQKDNAAEDDFRQNMVHYPIMVRPINTIIGEYISRISQLHGFYAKNESHYAKNQYLNTKTEMMRQWAEQQIMQAVYKKIEQSGIKTGTKEYDQAVQQQTPESIQDFMDRDYVDIAEQVVQTLMKNIWKTESLDSEFIEGFKYAAIVAKEFYHIYTVNGKTKIKNLSPLDVFYHKSPHVKWVSEGQFAGFRWFMTPSGIIDMFYDKLTVEHLKTIEALINPNAARSAQVKNQLSGAAGIQYDTQTYSDNYGNINEHMLYQTEAMITEFQRYGTTRNYSNNHGLIKVVRAYWKSYRQIGWLTSYNQDTDEEIIEMVDQNYKADASKGEHIEWTPCNQIYSGAKIANDIYLDVGPYQDQIVDIDDLQYCPLPIEGCTFNDTSSKPYSLVDLMIPWNELYNIIAYELREDINSSIGKVLFMSVDHIPNIPGFDMEKWYYWARKFKIAWVKQPKGGNNQFNQFSAADMSFAQQMQAKMDALERIKIECDAIAGFSPNRVAAANSQPATLGQSSQQLVASVNQTEYLFYRHSKLIERVLNQAMNLARKSLKDTSFLRNLFDDYELAFIDLDSELISNAKIGIFVTNSSDDQRKRQAIEALMQPAMQNGADLGDMSEMILSETIGQVRAISNKLRRVGNQTRMAEQKFKQQELQFKNDLETRKLDDLLTMSRERNEMMKETAYMKTFGGKNASPADDADADGFPDIVEWRGLDIKQQDMLQKHGIKEGELMFKRQAHTDDVKLKKEELRLKEKEINAQKYVAKVNK